VSSGSTPRATSTSALAGLRPPSTSSESAYCEIEKDWFTRADGPRRCVLRFSEYVRDLEGTMSRVYAECLDTPSLPPHVPREHAPRERENYLIDRSLADVGVDEEALNERLADYISWCRGLPPSAPSS
jgi:hypothetical protein